ncbi:MAG: alpha/beta hydrolase, partial [Bacteroidota bacterium]
LILLNGLRGNRSGLIQRARLYHAEGYCVLLPDLRGTGESERSVITFGWKERWDLMAAVEFIRQKGIQRIAAHGLSLGAATICYSLPEEPGFEYIVLESCYDNIQQALNNRLDMFGLPHWPFIGLQKITEWRIGAKAEQLAPEKYLATHQAPTLLIAGEAELKVRKEESEKLYRQCAAKQKKLHLIEGAKHENFMTRFAEETTQVLQQWIRQMEAQEPID